MASEVAAETGTGYVDGGNRPGNGEWETSTRNRPSMEAGQTLKTDLEAKIEEVEIPFRFWARKRLEAIAALGGLIAISVLPLFTIGGSIANTVADIGGESSKTWLALVHSLGVAAVAPFAGALSDLVGRRYLGMFGAAVVIAGMIVVGLANSMEVAILGMAITGAGGAFTGVIGFSGICELVPVHSRGRYIGSIFLAFFPMAPASAYAQMYSFTQTWRWGAWIPIAIAGVVFFLLLLQYYPPPRPNSLDYTATQVLGRIDYVGGFLSIVGIALLLVGLQLGGYNEPWISAPVLTTLSLGVVILILFIAWERFTKFPMIPSYVFAHPWIMLINFIILAFSGMVFYVFGAFWPLEIGQFFGPDPYSVARIITAFGFTFLIGIFVICWGIDLTRGRIRELFLIASCMMTAGVGTLAITNQNTPTLSIMMSSFGMFGVGALFVAPIVVLTIISSDDVIGTVVGLGMSIRLIFGQVGYSIFYNLLATQLAKWIPVIVAPALAEAGLPLAEIEEFIGAAVVNNQTAIAELQGVTLPVLFAAQEAFDKVFVNSFKIVYLSAMGLGAVAIIASVFLPSIKKHLTDRVAVDIH